MKELKVRAWLTEDEVMLPVESITLNRGSMDVVMPPHRKVTKAKQDVKLMQWTGLKDVHGKEIYEGDLIATPFEEDGLFEVLLDTTAGVHCRSLLTGKVTFIEYLDSLEELEEFKAEFAESFEVKGNIYKDKDLLGE